MYLDCAYPIAKQDDGVGAGGDSGIGIAHVAVEVDEDEDRLRQLAMLLVKTMRLGRPPWQKRRRYWSPNNDLM